MPHDWDSNGHAPRMDETDVAPPNGAIRPDQPAPPAPAPPAERSMPRFPITTHVRSIAADDPVFGPLENGIFAGSEPTEFFGQPDVEKFAPPRDIIEQSSTFVTDNPFQKFSYAPLLTIAQFPILNPFDRILLQAQPGRPPVIWEIIRAFRQSISAYNALKPEEIKSVISQMEKLTHFGFGSMVDAVKRHLQEINYSEKVRDAESSIKEKLNEINQAFIFWVGYYRNPRNFGRVSAEEMKSSAEQQLLMLLKDFLESLILMDKAIAKMADEHRRLFGGRPVPRFRISDEVSSAAHAEIGEDSVILINIKNLIYGNFWNVLFSVVWEFSNAINQDLRRVPGDAEDFATAEAYADAMVRAEFASVEICDRALTSLNASPFFQLPNPFGGIKTIDRFFELSKTPPAPGRPSQYQSYIDYWNKEARGR